MDFDISTDDDVLILSALMIATDAITDFVQIVALENIIALTDEATFVTIGNLLVA